MLYEPTWKTVVSHLYQGADRLLELNTKFGCKCHRFNIKADVSILAQWPRAMLLFFAIDGFIHFRSENIIQQASKSEKGLGLYSDALFILHAVI